MTVEMRDHLAAVLQTVEHQAVSGFGQALIPGDGGNCEEQSSEFLGVIRPEIVQAGYMAPGDEEDVGGGLGVDVPEGKDMIILMDLVGGKFPRGNSAEQTRCVHGASRIPPRIQPQASIGFRHRPGRV
jgi:hypothetical protein